MTALTIPQEVSDECAKKLFSLAATANRDAMTLVKQAMALAQNKEPARPLGVLKKYVGEHNQYGSDVVSEIIASISAAADPEHVKRLARAQAINDARRAKFEESHRKVLRQASSLMREQIASRDLIAAVLAFHEGRGSLWDVEQNLPDTIARLETWTAENQERIRAEAEAMVQDVLNEMSTQKPPHHENGNVVYLHEEGPGHDAA